MISFGAGRGEPTRISTIGDGGPGSSPLPQFSFRSPSRGNVLWRSLLRDIRRNNPSLEVAANTLLQLHVLSECLIFFLQSENLRLQNGKLLDNDLVDAKPRCTRHCTMQGTRGTPAGCRAAYRRSPANILAAGPRLFSTPSSASKIVILMRREVSALIASTARSIVSL